MGTGLSASAKFVTMPQATSVNTCELPTLVVPAPGWQVFVVRLLVSKLYNFIFLPTIICLYLYFSFRNKVPLPGNEIQQNYDCQIVISG